METGLLFAAAGADEAAVNNVGSARLITGDEEGGRQLDRSLRLAREAGLEEHVARAYTNLGSAWGELHRFALADRYLAEGIAYCAEHDLEQQRLYMVAWQAPRSSSRGAGARRRSWPARSRASRAPGPFSRITALVVLGCVRTRRGDPDVAPVLDEALDLATRTGEVQRLAPVRAARAEAAGLAGDPARAASEAREVYPLALDRRHPWYTGALAIWLWREASMRRRKTQCRWHVERESDMERCGSL